MANNFLSYKQRNIGTSATTMITANVSTQTVMIGLSLCNTTANSVTANVYVTSGGSDYKIVTNAPIPVGSALVVIGGDQKVVLASNDALKVQSSAATSIDAVLSTLEIT